MIIPLNREFNPLRHSSRVPVAKRRAVCYLVPRLPRRPAQAWVRATLRLPKIWRSQYLLLTKRYLTLPRKLEEGRRAAEYLKSTRLELSDSLVSTVSLSHSPKLRLWVVISAKVIPTWALSLSTSSKGDRRGRMRESSCIRLKRSTPPQSRRVLYSTGASLMPSKRSFF